MASRFTEFMSSEYIKSLVIYDDEYKQDAKKIKTLGKKVEKIFADYIKCLKNTANGMDGCFADNLNKFSEMAQLLLEDCFEGVCKTQQSKLNSYISEIDDADGDLY